MINEPPSLPETLLKAGVSLIPTVGGALAVIIQDMSDRRAYKAQETLAWVADTVGEAKLRQLAESDSEFDALLADMMFAAVRTGLDNKRRVLAKVVANAATSDEPIDPAQLVVAALTELDGPHIRALTRIRDAEKAANDTDSVAEKRVFNDPANEAAYKAGKKEPVPVLSTLVRTGVVYPATLADGGLAVLATTPFGRELLSYLEDESKPLP